MEARTAGVNMRPTIKKCYPANPVYVNLFFCKILIEYLLFLEAAEEPS